MEAKTILKDAKVGIIGCGNIGRSFAMLFAASGYKVAMYDKDSAQLINALKDIKERLEELQRMGLLRGTLSVTQHLQRISAIDDFKGCVQGAFYIQECVPELYDLKVSVLSKVDTIMDKDAILASSTSAIIPSKLSKKLKHRDRFLVVHPTNPPFYAPLVELIPTGTTDSSVVMKSKTLMVEIGQSPIVLKKEIDGFVLNRIQESTNPPFYAPLVELVPAPWTDPPIVTQSSNLMTEVGQSPVLLKKEIDGFAFNRIQDAIKGECWRLIEEDVISVEDLDKVMTEGLGRRYAFMGPLETAYLNADGMYSYADRYADMIYNIQCGFGPIAKQEGELLDRVQAELEAMIPMDKLKEQRQWRDLRLARLAKLIKDMDNVDNENK